MKYVVVWLMVVVVMVGLGRELGMGGRSRGSWGGSLARKSWLVMVVMLRVALDLLLVLLLLLLLMVVV